MSPNICFLSFDFIADYERRGLMTNIFQTLCKKKINFILESKCLCLFFHQLLIWPLFFFHLLLTGFLKIMLHIYLILKSLLRKGLENL